MDFVGLAVVVTAVIRGNVDFSFGIFLSVVLGSSRLPSCLHYFIQLFARIFSLFISSFLSTFFLLSITLLVFICLVIVIEWIR